MYHTMCKMLQFPSAGPFLTSNVVLGSLLATEWVSGWTQPDR